MPRMKAAITGRMERVVPKEDPPLPPQRGLLQANLDTLALQIVERATRLGQDGVPLEPLSVQLSALKTAGGYFATVVKLEKGGGGRDDEGSAWGDLSRALMAHMTGGEEEPDGKADKAARH